MKKHGHLFKILFFDMFVIEFGPTGVFLIAYYLSDFITAALWLGAATALALVISRVVNNRLPLFAIFSGSVTMLSALITFIYQSPDVLIIRDSVFYVLFAVLLGMSVWRPDSLFKKFFSHIFLLADEAWNTLERRWFVFFIVLAISNEFVRMNLTVEEWVIYKQVALVTMVVFGFYQLTVTRQYRLPGSDNLGFRKLRSQLPTDKSTNCRS